MAPQLKLTYFDATGRAEVPRLLFHYGNISFEDERISYEEFGKRKDTFPFKQLPVLQVDDTTTIAQSGAIYRYAAELVGLTPKDPILMAQVEMTLGAFADIGNAYVNMVYLTPEDQKEEKRMTFVKQTLPLFLGKIEEYATENGFIHADTLTVADFMAYQFMVNMLPQFNTFQLSDYPKLQKVVETIQNLPELSAYFKN